MLIYIFLVILAFDSHFDIENIFNMLTDICFAKHNKKFSNICSQNVHNILIF